MSAYEVALASNQRRAKALLVNGRSAASTKAAVVSDVQVAANGVGGFKGYVTGESVKQNGVTSNIWFVSNENHFYWAGGFTSQATTGLSNLGTRTAGSALVNHRAYPTTDTKVAPVLANGIKAGANVPVIAYANGVAPAGETNKIWFQLSDKTFAWSGGFTNDSVLGLTEVKVTIPAAPTGTSPAGTGTTTPVKPPVSIADQVTALEKDNTSLITANKNLTDQVATLKTQVAGLTTDKATLQAQVASLTTFKTTAVAAAATAASAVAKIK